MLCEARHARLLPPRLARPLPPRAPSADVGWRPFCRRTSLSASACLLVGPWVVLMLGLLWTLLL